MRVMTVRHAFVVDVQMCYRHLMAPGFIARLQSTIIGGRYHRIIAIFQEQPQSRIWAPRWLLERADSIVAKDYDESPGLAELLASAADYRPERSGWRSRQGELIVPTSNEHEAFLVRPELERELRRSSEQGAEIHLMGGERRRCLADVAAAMRYFGLTPHITLPLSFGSAAQPTVPGQQGSEDWAPLRLPGRLRCS